MGIFRNNKQNNNINNSGDMIINTYTDDNLKGIVTVKVYKYCEKCLKKFDTPSPIAFCDDFCRNEFYSENAREIDAVWREIRSID